MLNIYLEHQEKTVYLNLDLNGTKQFNLFLYEHYQI